ncbi:(Fe-S)-binding protein [Ideonella livida]|uniref:(Fe-S)-binding protein n=1 Tax=Ideonella livida TaxID=2707176 RepID=A0A7C9TKI7_9BURK|nr:(Fe-S)-binding protein [Ideonella livida]NDY91345.1 (Fe-S)-binding protein [Ideonella livida]
MTAASPPRPARVYVFATCVVDLMAPQAGLDVVGLIRRAGIAVDFPAGQSCCGQPAYTSGFNDEARRVAAAQLDLFVADQPIVVPSGSCAGMMVHHWPRLFADDAPRRAQAERIAAQVVEFSHFARDVLGLADAQGLGQAPVTRPVKVALHTSCSARREMGVHAPSRALLAALPGVEIVQQARETECCGFGGTFSARHPSISGAMVADKLAAVREAGAEVLVSADCGCLLNLHHAAQAQGGVATGQPRCQHLGSFLAERIGLAGGAWQVTD